MSLEEKRVAIAKTLATVKAIAYSTNDLEVVTQVLAALDNRKEFCRIATGRPMADVDLITEAFDRHNQHIKSLLKL